MTARRDSLSQIAAALDGARVFVFGDIILDRFCEGSVSRVSREAPIPILVAESESGSLGGAGLVWRNLASLGLKPGLGGIVGADGAGREIQRLLGAGGRRRSALVAGSEWSTPVKHRFLAQGQQLLRVDSGATLASGHAARAEAHRAARRSLKDFQAVILSDYGYGLFDSSLTPKLVAEARRRGRLVFVDPRGHDWTPYRGAHWCTPNLQELREASASPCGDDGEVVAAARTLIRRHGLHGLLVTRSERGMTLVTKSAARHVRAESREVYDVTGAGDTVIAVFAAALAAGAEATDAARLANLAAGVVVSLAGPAPVDPLALRAATEHADTGSAAKRVTAAAARRQVRAWRESGKRVGFTNGCFDLLHPGHLALLEGARRCCDRLVVAVNGDASVRRLKGSGRPVQGLSERMALLSALRSADLVVSFDEDTPERLIRQLCPDVLVKGADYRGKALPGADFVVGRGGEVVLVPLLRGHGTTSTIKRASPAKN